MTVFRDVTAPPATVFVTVMPTSGFFNTTLQARKRGIRTTLFDSHDRCVDDGEATTLHTCVSPTRRASK